MRGGASGVGGRGANCSTCTTGSCDPTAPTTPPPTSSRHAGPGRPDVTARSMRTPTAPACAATSSPRGQIRRRRRCRPGGDSSSSITRGTRRSMCQQARPHSRQEAISRPGWDSRTSGPEIGPQIVPHSGSLRYRMTGRTKAGPILERSTPLRSQVIAPPARPILGVRTALHH